MSFMKKNISATNRRSGYSLLETLVAIGIASIVITSALSVVVSIYYSQKRLQFTQDFYSEGRYLMERISQMVRNNTIDYDNYFHELGPPIGGTNCDNFAERQNPTGNLLANTEANRKTITYETVFFWNTNNSLDNVQNRNLGGKTPGPPPQDDPCSLAWDSSSAVDTLYLIDARRQLRTAVSFVDTADPGSDPDDIQVRRQLTTDLDDDGRGDVWGPYDADGDGNYEATDGDVNLIWNSTTNTCEIIHDADASGSYGSGEVYPVMGDPGNQDFCEKAHDFVSIVPPAILVNEMTFRPAPDRDPFLAFRIDEAQVHPHVFMYLDIEIDNPNRYGFEIGDAPTVSFQTAVGSRVFGNIRR